MTHLEKKIEEIDEKERALEAQRMHYEEIEAHEAERKHLLGKMRR